MNLPANGSIPLPTPVRPGSLHLERLPDKPTARKGGQGSSPLRAAYLRRSGVYRFTIYHPLPLLPLRPFHNLNFHGRRIQNHLFYHCPLLLN